jgi:FKBP-type peptidyl-prolyl cis-trans isomerase SlyD
VNPNIQPNSFVTLDYTLKDDKGSVLDESAAEGGEPIKYVHGYGMLVPGLEAGLVGLAAGDKKLIVVSAEAGFGERDEELVLELDRTEFPDPEKITAGDEFIAESPDGDEVVMRVVALKPDAVVVDANHPLAGQTLHYAVSVREVREATAEEIETAATAFEEAEGHVHGDGCGHDHDHDHDHNQDGGSLITLGSKLSKFSAPPAGPAEALKGAGSATGAAEKKKKDLVN